jgi:glycosyltransferase involved in cell wall biosynthesis
MNVLFITPAPMGISPGQRFRFEHYLRYFPEAKVDFTIRSFFSLTGWKTFYSKGNTLKKLAYMILGVLKRTCLLFGVMRYDMIYVYREVLPFGPPVFEWLIAKLLGKKIIYDFDDAIWIPLSSTANPIAGKIKCTWKVGYICRWSHIVTTGNQFLGDYAKQYCKDVRVIPTVVDTETAHNKLKDQQDKPLAIGWTGTFTNFLHLPLAIPALKELQKKIPFNLIIIADNDPELKDINYKHIKWNKETEVEDLMKMNIGIMPLLNTDVQRGKCAFKAIQYMSLGIPSVVSPVGANCEVVENGVDGYWADNDKEWFNTLEKLLMDTDSRTAMGRLAQKKIQNNYSVNATKDLFLRLFNV